MKAIKPDNSAGFCYYHKCRLSFRQMRNHGCLDKHGTWCKRFEPNVKHAWWQDKLNKGKATELITHFIEARERRAE